MGDGKSLEFQTAAAEAVLVLQKLSATEATAALHLITEEEVDQADAAMSRTLTMTTWNACTGARVEARA